MSDIVTIDFSYPRIGRCRVCKSDRTVFPVKAADGSWSWACKDCAFGAKAMA